MPHNRQNVMLVVVILTALYALASYFRWLYRAPTLSDVHEMLRWHASVSIDDDGKFLRFGKLPDVTIGNGYASLRYWRVDSPEFLGLEALACTTRQHRDTPLLVAFHEGEYMQWHGKEKRPRHIDPASADIRLLEDLFILARQFVPSSPDRS